MLRRAFFLKIFPNLIRKDSLQYSQSTEGECKNRVF